MRDEKVPAVLKKFVDGITKAHGGASQMVHHHQDPRFIPIYKKLGMIKEKSIDIAMKATGIEVQNVIKH